MLWCIMLVAISHDSRFAGLFYLFLGVNVVSDYFMNAVEMILSEKKRHKNADGRTFTATRWNGIENHSRMPSQEQFIPILM